jgi:hypothetical protein
VLPDKDRTLPNEGSTILGTLWSVLQIVEVAQKGDSSNPLVAVLKQTRNEMGWLAKACFWHERTRPM